MFMKNALRDKIKSRNYIELINDIEMSQRNKDIIIKFVDGATYSAIAKEYGISKERVRYIVSEYSRHCYNH